MQTQYRRNTGVILVTLSSLTLPVLTQITVIFGFNNDRKDALRMFDAIVSCAAQSTLLENSRSHTPNGYPSIANHGILHVLADKLPHLGDVSVTGPVLCSTYDDSRIALACTLRKGLS